MTVSYTDIHVARKTMSLKNENACFSFIKTVWCGEVIMCCFNNLNNEISQIYCFQEMEESDIKQLTRLIKMFIS